MTIEGGAVKPDDRVVTHNNLISPGYFKALGMKLVAGRREQHDDDGTVDLLAANPTTVIVNQTFVKRYLGERYPPAASTLDSAAMPGTPCAHKYVGVVSDAKYAACATRPSRRRSSRISPDPTWASRCTVRTVSENTEGMFASLRRVVQQLDPNLPLFAMQTFETRVQPAAGGQERLIASLSSVLASSPRCLR